MIQVGTGGFGREWCRSFLPPNVEDGLVEVVAAADVNPAALENAREFLALPAERCYTDVRRAFEEAEADFCTVVVPPSAHEEIVDLALDQGMDILSEKPIADTLEASVRIAAKVKAAGRKMGVTMSHRFDRDKTTLRELVRSEDSGPLDYLVCRFTCDCRKHGDWGAFRHDIPDTLMVEGAVHHLDILADLAGSRCRTICARTWNPEWGEFAGDSQGLVLMDFENGARAFYEGAKTNAAGLNWWGNEYIRAECRDATLVMNHRRIERFRYPGGQTAEGEGEEVPLLERGKWSHAWLVEKFARWLGGGGRMETNVEDNLQSVALVFSAIESSRRGGPVEVQEFLAEAVARVEAG